jgi:hypothetical protein
MAKTRKYRRKFGGNDDETREQKADRHANISNFE